MKAINIVGRGKRNITHKKVLVHFTATSSVCVHFCLFSIQSRYSVNCSFPSTKWSETCTTTRIPVTSVIFGTICGGGCNMHFYPSKF